MIVDNNVSTEGVGGIFTVLTSPDVDTAFRWGHMPETVEGPDGVTYTRPKLQSEVPSGVGFYNKTMNIGRIQRLFKLKRQGQRAVILPTNRC